MSKDLTESLRRMMGDPLPGNASSYQPKRLPAPMERPPVPAKSASAFVEKTVGGGGNDMTEMDYSQREYYTTGYKSSDGLFFMPAIKKVVTNNGTITFAQPTTP